MAPLSSYDHSEQIFGISFIWCLFTLALKTVHGKKSYTQLDINNQYSNNDLHLIRY